jgi:hypothetical protein
VPDIVDLLQTTARPGTSELDLAWLERRARRLRGQQRARRTLAAIAVLAAVPLVLSLPGHQDALEQLPATEPSTATEPTPRTAPSPGVSTTAGGPRPTAAPSDAASAQPPGAPSVEPPPRASDQASSPPSPAGTTYPPGDSCHVGTATLLPDQTDSCQFTAQRAGGWLLVRDSGAGVIQPEDAVVEVRRAGVVTRYLTGDNLQSGKGCRSDVVRPGDLVKVTVHQTSRGYQRFDLGAGAGYGC